MAEDFWSTTAVESSGVEPGTAAGVAVERRMDIMQMTQTAEDAVLRPADPGAWPHELRLALACRIARLNNASRLAAKYLEMLGASHYSQVADPTVENSNGDLVACLAFTDRVAKRPSAITEQDIQVLQGARIADADIVRLTELNAFMAYQIRLVAGLALISGIAS